MPRIRTIKPEFFRSPDTAKVSFEGRLFYQALWCWADDFGIGETNLNGLLGFAFCDEDGMSAQDLRRFCAEVAQHYSVTFYTVRGRHYYAIPTWEKHQKIERRGERRKYPPPTDPDAMPDLRILNGADSAPQLRRESGAESRENSAGTGELGRGEIEELHRPAEPDAPNKPAPAAPPGFDEFWTAYPRKDAKRKALQAYGAAVKRADPEKILRGAKLYAALRRGKDPKYTKLPESWLNADSWDDQSLASVPEPGTTASHLAAAGVRRMSDGTLASGDW